ncbi:U-scoloptoxin(11)-Sm5a [Folsomia candida]|uniref:U-scoloptoxin(11)-Sm5a n=1 Tax=Folsomia candida TaxID=158441 RepID=UPI00160546B5|nr:U-scoloptoxin(11)-Sm5a [Folsomia candida]
MYTYFSMYLLTSLGSTHANIRPGFLYLARTPTSSLILFPSPKVDIFLRLALFNSSHLKHFLHVSISPTSPLQSYRMVSPRWLGVSHWTCSVLIVFLSDTLSEARTYLHLQTNQVEDMRYDDSVLDLPTCRDDSICGFLQANSHGINVQQRCACPGVGARCPLTWDTFDGHSVTMGSDQYKYCGAAPELKVCANMYTAYTSLMMYAKVKEEDENMLSATSAEKDDEKLVLSSDHLKCICPETHNYVLVHKGFSSPEVDTEAIHLSYICSPLGTCSAGEPCKTLSSTPSQFLVQRKCNCPSGLRCPTETTKGITSTLWNKGFSFEIRCQK